jgi:hypothetical protein
MPGVQNWQTTPLVFIDTIFSQLSNDGNNDADRVSALTSTTFDSVSDFFKASIFAKLSFGRKFFDTFSSSNFGQISTQK